MTVADDKVAFELPEPSQSFLLWDVSWEAYELLLRDTEHTHVRLTYDNGRLSAVAPSAKHEGASNLIGFFVQLLGLDLNVRMRSLATTTWKRHDLLRGLQADQCFYVQNEPRVRTQQTFDLFRDPVPDLAIEVDITHHPVERMSIYASLRVPEVWRYDDKHVVAFELSGGQYRPIERSIALPMLRPADLERFLDMAKTDEDAAKRAFREWLTTLA
jgi:Uma2 family endonuclease